jgi:plasmid stabilization system protein ParE
LTKTYHVKVVRRAREDIQHILDWLTPRSSEGAQRWLAALDQAKSTLVTSPVVFGLAAEGIALDREVRERFFKTRRGRVYRLMFIVVGDEVRILRVRGPGQPPVSSGDIID